jgi:RHS repeat-associated protein
MVLTRQHFVPNPVLSMRTVFTPKCKSPLPRSLHTRYDDDGHRTQAAATIDGIADYVDDYAYDELSRVVTVARHDVEDGNAVANQEIDFVYNNDNSIASITRYLDGELVVTADYSYDAGGRLVGLVYHQGENILNSYTWTYNADGSAVGSEQSPGDAIHWLPTGGLLPVHDTSGVVAAITDGGFSNVALLASCTSSDGTAAYSYDPTGQLIAVTGDQANESYSYDANGNRVTANGSTYTTGTDNRLISDGTYTYSYDAEGNRVAKFIDTNTDGVLDTGDTDITQYAWDNRNRLVEVTSRAIFGGDPTQIVQYRYDPENRLVGENIDSNGDGQIDHQIRFAYDGNQIVLQFDKDGEDTVTGDDLSHRYLWQANAVDQLMADERTHLDNGSIATDEVLWALTNQQGSVNDLAKRDAATGVTSVVDHIIRDSYGNVISESDPSQGSLIGWTGRPVDEATGLQNNLNRWYDAKVGRWASEDPAESSPNLYEYCGDSPLMLTDPTGEQFVPGTPNSPYQPVPSTPAAPAPVAPAPATPAKPTTPTIPATNTLGDLAAALASIATSAKCKAEAKRIGDAIKNTFNENYSYTCAAWGGVKNCIYGISGGYLGGDEHLNFRRFSDGF